MREIAGEANSERQQERLNDFVADHFKKGMAAKEAELADALRRFTLYTMQRYRTRYLLAKLTQFVDMAYKGLKVGNSLETYAGLEIEHILPDNPKEDLRAYFSKTNPGADYDEYKIKLGNLTLLEKPINIVASNDFFIRKKKEYANCKYYLTSSIAGLVSVGKNSSITRINAKLQAFDTWNAKDIDKRQELMLGLAKEIWKVVPIEVN